MTSGNPVQRALLLTDVVDSTQLAETVGDSRMASIWAVHDRVARDLLPAHRGLEIDKTDGFLMLFDSARDAAGYALAYHRAIEGIDPPLKARAGIHVGSVILRPNAADDVARGAKPLEVDGLAKPLAARVMSLATGGQTLITAEALQELGPTSLRVESHGHWRVKGLREPIELFEVGGVHAPFVPPPDSAKVYRVVQSEAGWHPVREVPNSLPKERDAFVGRASLLAELSRRFDGGERLITVTGVGGVGKTRLAARYGWSWLGDWSGGAWYCDLEAAQTEEQVLAAVARGLQIPLDREGWANQLGASIAGRGRCLVLIDAVERVADTIGSLVAQWLDQSGEACFLVTSRRRLGLRGERAIEVAPLARETALSLLQVRAEAVRPGWSTDDERSVCRRLVDGLDRLPLAIELAAARLRVLPPETLLERLSRRFDLLRARGGQSTDTVTLRATLDDSWALLDDCERAGLAQLSVFEGGFTLKTAEAVLDLGEGSPMDVVESLANWSLVRLGPPRMLLLRSVREYAAERLVELDMVRGARARHGRFFAALPEDQRSAELKNLVAGCEWACGVAEAATAVACLEGAWEVLYRVGPLSLAIRLAVQALGVCTAPHDEARALRLGALAAHAAGHVEESRTLTERALEGFEALGMRSDIGWARGHLGLLLLEAGRWDEARVQLQHALELQREDLSAQARITGLLGLVARPVDQAEARTLFHEAIRLAQAAADPRTEAAHTVNLAGLLYRDGDYEGARHLLKQTLPLFRQAGDQRSEATILSNMGSIYLDQGRYSRSRECLEAALRMNRRMGNRRGAGAVLSTLGWLYDIEGDDARARAHYEAALEISREVKNRPSEGIALGNLGALHLKHGRLAEARQALEASLAIHVEVRGRAFAGHVTAALGRLAIAEDRLEEGRSLLDEALAIARETGQVRYEAEALTELGELHVRLGRPGMARMALEIADTLLRDGPHLREHERVTALLEQLPE